MSPKRTPAAAAAATAGLAVVLIAHTAGGHVASAAPPASKNTPQTALPPSGGQTGSTSPTTSSGPKVTGSAVGALEQFGYGEVSVKVTAQSGRVVNVSVVTLRVAESYSQSIAQQVVPMLKNEVVSAQSARISAISGATYTSEGYAASVQSALDKLHLK